MSNTLALARSARREEAGSATGGSSTQAVRVSSVVRCADCGVLLGPVPAGCVIQDPRERGRSQLRPQRCSPCAEHHLARLSERRYRLVLAMLPVGVVLFYLDPTAGFFVLAVPLFLITNSLLLVPHELGHALVAWLVGAQVHEVVIGVGRPLVRRRVGSTVWELRATPLGGHTTQSISSRSLYRTRLVAITAAGVCVTAAIGWLAWSWTPALTDHWSGVVIWSFRWMVLAAASFQVATNLWPRDLGSTVNRSCAETDNVTDGLALVQACRMSRAEVERQLTAGAPSPAPAHADTALAPPPKDQRLSR